MKRKISSIILLALCIAFTVATVVNVFGDNQDVLAMAKKTACGDTKDCKYAESSMMRTPIGQTFTFRGGGNTVEITCRRAYIMFGEYACKAP